MSRLCAVLMVSTLAVALGASVTSEAAAAEPRHQNALTSDAPDPDIAARAERRLPPVDAAADYQLGGAYPPPDGVMVVTRDRTARPAPGAYGICYLNAFQTQPGALPWWRGHHPRLLLRDHRNRLVRDPGWPAEVLLDTSTSSRRHLIAAVMTRWIKGCRAAGFQAVEPDNLDSFTRFHSLLSRGGALALSTLLASAAHDVHLALAQKNLAGLSREQRRAVGFDFAVSEECMVWRECSSYRAAYGRRVIEIEYTDNGRRAYRQACADHGNAWSIVLRDRLLRTPGSHGYAFATC